MTLLILGLVIFLGVHSAQMLAPAWRGRMVARIGLRRWKGLYSLLSLIGLALIVYGFGAARGNAQALYLPPVALRHLNALFTLIAFVLIAAAYIPRNHFKARIGHPMLAGVALWAAGHLLATGLPHDVVLFGAFLIWAVADFSVSRRRDRHAAAVYPAGTLAGTGASIAIAVIAWIVFAFLLHGPLIGVKPFG